LARFSSDQETRLVAAFFGNIKGYYVEVGANDPRERSQTWHLEQQGWTGVLIEPQPDLAATLRAERKGKVFAVALPHYPAIREQWLVCASRFRDQLPLGRSLGNPAQILSGVAVSNAAQSFAAGAQAGQGLVSRRIIWLSGGFHPCACS